MLLRLSYRLKDISRRDYFRSKVDVFFCFRIGSKIFRVEIISGARLNVVFIFTFNLEILV